MLEHLTDIFLAREQVMLLLATLGLVLLGVALVVDYIMMRLTARAYQGKIRGVRVQAVSSTKSGKVYFPVVEYTDESGRRIQAETDAGSSGLADKAPGRTVTLLVVPGRPHEGRITGYSRLVFSGIFILAGILLGAFTLAGYAVTSWTYGVGLVILVTMLGFGIRKLLAMKGRDDEPAPPDNKYQQRLQEKRSMKFIGAKELHLLLREQNARTRRWAPVAVLVALILIGVGHYLARDLYVLLLQGESGSGEIVSYERTQNSNSEYVYYPAVEFTTTRGRHVRFIDRVGSSSPGSRGRDSIGVLYLPEDPETAMIDRGIWNWAAPGGILFFGLLLLLVSVKSWYRIVFQRRLMGNSREEKSESSLAPFPDDLPG